MVTRRGFLALPPALAVLAATRPARAEPAVGRVFPGCAARDLNNHWHTHVELFQRRTFVTAITGTGAGEPMRHWLNNAEARYGQGGPIVAMVALALDFYAWDGIVRDQARGHTPAHRYGYVWLDRDGTLQRALGLANGSPVAWAFVVERTGVVSAAIHENSNHASAQLIWDAMAAP